MNENETPPLKDLMPEDKMGMMESAKGMGMRSVFPDADWQLYEQRKAQMAEEPVVQGSEVRPANNSANLLSQMAENPEATARAANSLGEAAGIAPFDDSLTEDQKMRLHRMERSIDVDPNTNKSYQPDQIEKQRRDFVDENARLVGGVAKGEPAETIPPEPEELDPSEPILGVVEGIVEPVEGERTTQDILNDLKRVGGKMFSDQREALVEKLRAEGVNLSDRVNEDTPEGRYERWRLREAAGYVDGTFVPERRADGTTVGWESQEKAAAYLENLGVDFGSNDNKETEEKINVGETTNVLSDLEKIQKQVETICEKIPNPKHRTIELNRLLNKIDNLEARAWVFEQLNGLERTPEIDTNKAEDDLNYILNPMNFGDNLRLRRQRAGQWVAKYLELYQTTQLDDGSFEYPDEIKELIRIKDGEDIKFGEIEKEGKIRSEEDLIREFCLQQIFEMSGKEQARSSQEILGRLTANNGFLVTGLFKTPSEAQSLLRRTREIVEEMGLNNWIAIRDVHSAHGELKKANTENFNQLLNPQLMAAPYVERFFAGIYSERGEYLGERKILLPGESEPINIESAVSGAMLELRNYFDKTDYYVYVGADSAVKADLFSNLKINKYVGEVAFTLLLSNIMLTECEKTSTDDPFLYVTKGDERRMSAFGVDPSKDSMVRAQVQALMARGYRRDLMINPATGKFYKPEDGDKYDFVRKNVKEFLLNNFPCHLISTGRSGEGLAHLEGGDWLKWKADHTFTIAERNHEIEEIKNNRGRILKVAADNGIDEAQLVDLARQAKVKGSDEERKYNLLKDITLSQVIANDTETRIEEIRQAVAILEAFKTAMKPESGVKTLLALRAALAVMSKVKYSSEGRVNSRGLIDAEFGYGEPDKRVPLSHDEWATKAMSTACMVYMLTHSGSDYMNESPLNLRLMAKVAREMLSHNPLNDQDAYFGFNPNIRNGYRQRFVNYVNNLLKWTKDVYFYARDNELNNLPDWYNTEGGLSDGVIKAANESYKMDEITRRKPSTEWEKVKKDLGFN